MPIRAIFTEGIKELTVSGLTQWDYGQKLEIHGLALPAMIEVHFACLNMTEAVVRIGTTADGVTTVAIPDGCLEHNTPLRAWVYVVDTASGKTERTIHLPIQARTKPQGADSRPPFAVDEYAAALEQINNTVDSWRDGIVDQNDGGKTKVWTGTRAQFNALTKIDDHTVYIITDELPDYTDLVKAYEAVVKALAFMTAVENGDKAVPKATQTHYDMSGRALNKMGSFEKAFQEVTKLTEVGVYQMYIEADFYHYPLPLVSFGGAAQPYPLRMFANGTTFQVLIHPDGTIEGYGPASDDLARDGYIYARLVAPFAGW